MCEYPHHPSLRRKEKERMFKKHNPQCPFFWSVYVAGVVWSRMFMLHGGWGSHMTTTDPWRGRTVLLSRDLFAPIFGCKSSTSNPPKMARSPSQLQRTWTPRYTGCALNLCPFLCNHSPVLPHRPNQGSIPKWVVNKATGQQFKITLAMMKVVESITSKKL